MEQEQLDRFINRLRTIGEVSVEACMLKLPDVSSGIHRASAFFSYLFIPSIPSPFLPDTFFSLSIIPQTFSWPFHSFILFSPPLPFSLVCILPWSQGVSGCRTELLPASYPPPYSPLPHASLQLPTATGIQHPADLSHSKHSARSLEFVT